MKRTDPVIEQALSQQALSRADLARQLGITPQALSRTLAAGQLLSARSHWPAILEALNLEVVIQPKQK